MYVFSHLHKAAGTTVNHALRRTFGLRHLDVIPRKGHLYKEEDLQYDFLKFKEPQSIAGHCLRPHIDYGIFEHEMEWYTIIRDPLRRCISHYQHQVQKLNKSISFLDWIQIDHYRNWMVKFYGGSSSVQQAIDCIHQKKVGIIDVADGLETGMQRLFSGELMWKESVRNPAKNNTIRDRILSSKELMQELQEANKFDLELFRYMKSTKMNSLSNVEFIKTVYPSVNTLLSLIYRNLVYKRVKQK